MASPVAFGGTSERAYEAALRNAFDAWISPNCTSFRHRYAGKLNAPPSQSDGRILVHFATSQEWATWGLPSTITALATPVTNGNDGWITDADIIINPSPLGFGWAVQNISSSQFDLTSTVAHEIGHVLGFGHSSVEPNPPNPGSLMYYQAAGIGPLWSTFYGSRLPNDDVQAVCSTYPAVTCRTDKDCGGCFSCSANKTCIPLILEPTSKFCKPCAQDADCAGTSNQCLATAQGYRCFQACVRDSCCPTNTRCADVGNGRKQCVPNQGICPALICRRNQDCGPGETCQRNQCKPRPVPRHPEACKPCSGNNTCSADNKCLNLQGDPTCFQPCAANLFCPAEYTCRKTNVGNVCVPDAQFCPCTQKSDCFADKICTNGRCTRPGGGILGDLCSDELACASDHQCQPSGNSKICVQFCGPKALFTQGSPGSRCRVQGTCTQGSVCQNLNGTPTCMPATCPNGTCANGEQCRLLLNQPYCFCQNDSECRNGTRCNISGIFGKDFGVCAKPPPPKACSAESDCIERKDLSTPCSSQSELCVCSPRGTQDIGMPCSYSQLCKRGLTCLQLGKDRFRCFESCDPKQANACTRSKLQCTLKRENSNFCACSKSVPCPQGQKCFFLENRDIGYCDKEAPPVCGDEACEPNKNEHCGNCPQDCRCLPGQICDQKICKNNPVKCGDNKCTSPDENCGTCSLDCACPQGQTCQQGQCKEPSTTCGNQTCESNKDEDCTTCPQDCKCARGQVCERGQCQQDPCGNGTCDPQRNENCTTCPQDCGCARGQSCQQGVCRADDSCGNQKCEPTKNEGCATCPQDCGCPKGQSCINNTCDLDRNCGDGKCLGRETCISCPGDCQCPVGSSCQRGQCIKRTKCGNDICDDDENCGNCQADCFCLNQKVCRNKFCVAPTEAPASTESSSSTETTNPDRASNTSDTTTLNCPPQQQQVQCDDFGKNCKTICTGCQCQNAPSSPLWMLMLLGLVLLIRRRKRR
ncbi:MAG: matrixin family metalloprotease, partial [Myxococcota bacterium]